MTDAATQTIINQTLLDAVSSIKGTSQFVAAQIPDVLHQFLIFRLVFNVTFLVCDLACVIAALMLLRWRCRVAAPLCGRERFDADDKKQMAFMLNVFTIPIGVIAAIICLLHILEIIIAPKIYLLEYAVNMIH